MGGQQLSPQQAWPHVTFGCCTSQQHWHGSEAVAVVMKSASNMIHATRARTVFFLRLMLRVLNYSRRLYGRTDHPQQGAATRHSARALQRQPPRPLSLSRTTRSEGRRGNRWRARRRAEIPGTPIERKRRDLRGQRACREDK